MTRAIQLTMLQTQRLPLGQAMSLPKKGAHFSERKERLHRQCFFAPENTHSQLKSGHRPHTYAPEPGVSAYSAQAVIGWLGVAILGRAGRQCLLRFSYRKYCALVCRIRLSIPDCVETWVNICYANPKLIRTK